MALERQYRHWIDADGRIALLRYTGVGALNALIAQIDVWTNADYYDYVENTLIQNVAPAPNTAVYRSVLDQAELLFTCADGTTASFRIPAPLSGMFLADNLTVDPSAIPLLRAAAIGLLCSATGSPATAYQSGYRVKR